MKRYILPLILLITIISSFIPFNSSVYAAIDTLAVSGEGTDHDAFFIEGYTNPPNNYTVLNTDDGATQVWYSNTQSMGFKYRSWAITNSVVIGTVTNVRLTAKIADDGGSNLIKLYTYDGTRHVGSQHTTTLTYDTYTEDWGTNPSTGSTWTIAQINAAEFGVGTSTGNLNFIKVTYMYLTITYTPPTVASIITNSATLTANTTSCNVTMSGTVTADGGAAITERGFAWGTTCNSTTPASTQTPPAGYSTNWTEGSASWGTGTYTHTANVTCCASYCYRAYAKNSAGYAWGDEIHFTTMCEPNITTVAATYIGATTARLNSVVVYDGEQACDVRFAYSTVSGNCTNLATCATGSCNSTSYNGTTPWILDTYYTGNTPYIDLSGLVTSKTYYFCSIIQNDKGCRCGGQLSFTTASGIAVPSGLNGIPTGTTISLLWIKGTGSTNTLIRYKTGGYPSSTADGTQAYFDTKTSTVVTSLTPGLTYYFMAWGESGGTYSTTNATVMITTLASSSAAGEIPAPTTPTTWYQAPDATSMSQLPWYGLVNFFADSFQIPRSTLWFMSAMLMVLAAGILTYAYGGQKILLSDIVCILGVGIATAMHLSSLWLLVPFIIILFSALALGERI